MFRNNIYSKKNTLVNRFGILILKFIIISIVISHSSFSIAQKCTQSEIDSIKQKITKKNIKSVKKIDAWNKLSSCYTYFDLDSAKKFAELAHKESIEIDYKKGMANSSFNLANVANKNGHYDQSLLLIDQTIELYKDIEKDLDYFNSINLAGVIYESQHKYYNALEYYYLGLRDAELLGFKLDAGFFFNNISNIYFYTGDREEELKNLRKASVIFRDMGEDYYYSYTLLNIGSYFNSEEMLDSARTYFLEAEPLLLRDHNYYGLTNLYSNLSDLELKSGTDKLAFDYLQKSLRNAELIDSTDSDRLDRLASINIKFGNFQLSKEKFYLAIKHFRKALGIAQSYHSLYQLHAATEGLFKSLFYLGESDSAMHYYHLLVSYKDSLSSEKYNEKIDQLNYDYQLQKEKESFTREKEWIYFKKNRQELIYLSIVGFLLSISLMVFFIWRLQKIKLQKSELVRENLNLENKNMTLALERKNKELTTTLLNLIERNEFIAKVSEQLSEINTNENLADSKGIQDIIRSIDKDSTNYLWKEFESRYMEVHKDFHKKLTSKYPDLTNNDRKLCAFIMLNMTTKDISSITYQSTHSIKIARYRLRKKLGLDKNENLSIFLHNL